MKKTLVIFLSAYYAFGALCLPMGDFSALKDLPRMYRHCKATEDKDMTPLDFITDHLINIDCLFDKHDNGDEQKPHNPPPTHHQQVQVFCPMTFSYFSFSKPLTPEKKVVNYCNNYYRSDFTSGIFRPPIV